MNVTVFTTSAALRSSAHKYAGKPQCGRSKGFTLIELLVVIAIIASLAAILFPVFGRARENARRSTCQSNLKQIGLSFTQYSQDYDERYPAAEGGPAEAIGWDKRLEPYLGQKVGGSASGIFMCPSDYLVRHTNTPPFDPRTYAMPFPSGSGEYGTPGDPGMAGTKAATSSSTRPDLGVALSQVPDPAQTLMVVEMPHKRSSFGGGARLSCFHPQRDTSQAQARVTIGDGTMVLAPIHFDGWNHLFVDGHVKWLKPLATVDGTPGVGSEGSLGYPRGMWTLRSDD